MNEEKFLEIFEQIALNGRIYKLVANADLGDGVDVAGFGFMINEAAGTAALTQEMIEEADTFLNTPSYVNSLMSQSPAEASFCLMLPSIKDASETWGDRNTRRYGTFVARDIIKYRTSEEIRVKTNASLQITHARVGDNIHVDVRAFSGVSPQGSTVGGRTFGRPFGVETSEGSEVSGVTHAIVIYPKTLSGEFGTTILQATIPAIENYYADCPYQVSVVQGTDTVTLTANTYMKEYADRMVNVTDLASLQVAYDAFNEKTTLGAVDLRLFETIIRTSASDGDYDEETVDIYEPVSPIDAGALYQVKSPLNHSNGVGTIGDLLLRVSPEVNA